MAESKSKTTMESSPMASMAPLLLRNFITSLFIVADKSLLNLAGKYKLLETIRYWLVASFLFLLRVIPSLNPKSSDACPPRKDSSVDLAAGGGGGEDSGIARALSQLLSIASNLPASSRKYELVRGLVEEIVEENQRDGALVLLEVNRTVLSAAFGRTIGRLEAAVVAEQGGGGLAGPVQFRLNRVLRAVRDVAWARVGGTREEELGGSGSSAEKLAAELLWLSQKMAGCGFADEAVRRWASASNLAWLAIYAEDRLQGFMVKISAFLFKQANEMGHGECVEGEKDQQKQIRMKMLMSWLPLLCRASNGSDMPVLTSGERAALENILEETIEMLEGKEQEQVLALWLYHFTYNPSSDWPNLHTSYTRWCTASRNLLLLH